MSVKLMTTEQIHTNLATIHNMWAGGIPPEQNDQVNALKSELKRRGVEMNAQAPILPQAKLPTPEGMTMEQLQLELANTSVAIGKNPNDEALQEHFANVRFELRKRTKTEPAPAPPMVTPPAPETNGRSNNFIEQGNASARMAPDFQRTIDEAAKSQAAQQLQRMQDMEQLVRKHNLAKIAADAAAKLLTVDSNGDDIEVACNIGLQVAEKIFEKVGL